MEVDCSIITFLRARMANGSITLISIQAVNWPLIKVSYLLKAGQRLGSKSALKPE